MPATRETTTPAGADMPGDEICGTLRSRDSDTAGVAGRRGAPGPGLPPSVPSVHAEELPAGVVPAVTIASTQQHGPGSDLWHIVWDGRPWRSRPRIVWATDDERRCPACRHIYPCHKAQVASWPY